jgi:potassium channel LctB
MIKHTKRIQKKVQANIHKNVKEVSRFGKLLFNRPILKFFIFVVVNIIFTTISSYFPRLILLRIILDFINILIAIYFVAIIVYLIRRWFLRLLNPKNIFALISTYALFILGLILLFSTIYNIVELSGLGYIKYGTCNGKFDSSMITTDPDASHDFFYFSAMTFFTVGYGDICPMGFEKIISIIVAFTGNLVSVILVALILNNYLDKKK